MIHYHDFVYSVPQAFVEEDDYLPLATIGFDEDYWQQSMSLDLLTRMSLWVDDNERISAPAPARHIVDEDGLQMRLHLITTQHVSLWL